MIYVYTSGNRTLTFCFFTSSFPITPQHHRPQQHGYTSIAAFLQVMFTIVFCLPYMYPWWSVRQVGPKIGFLGTDGPQSTSADQSLCHDDISRFIDHCRAPFAIATQHCQSPLPPHTPWHYLAYREHASSHSDQHHDKPAPAPITLPHTSQRHYTSISSLLHGDREHSPHDKYILAAEEQQRPIVDHSQRIFPSVRQKQSSTRARTTQATKCPSP